MSPEGQVELTPERMFSSEGRACAEAWGPEMQSRAENTAAWLKHRSSREGLW